MLNIALIIKKINQTEKHKLRGFIQKVTYSRSGIKFINSQKPTNLSINQSHNMYVWHMKIEIFSKFFFKL